MKTVLFVSTAALLLLSPAAVAKPKSPYVYGVCGSSLCKVKAQTGKKTIFAKGDAAKPFASIGVSRSGTRVAYVRGEEVFLGGRNARNASRVGAALRQAAPEVNVAPDGRQFSWIDFVQRPITFCPSPPCGFDIVPELNVRSIGGGDSETHIVASDLRSAGWLGSTIIRQAFGETEGAPWFICAWTAEDGCIGNVAIDPQRALDDAAAGSIVLFDARTGSVVRTLVDGANVDPAFSPDGKRVAFVRGHDLYVVATAGGRAKRLARNVSDPAWATR